MNRFIFIATTLTFGTSLVACDQLDSLENTDGQPIARAANQHDGQCQKLYTPDGKEAGLACLGDFGGVPTLIVEADVDFSLGDIIDPLEELHDRICQTPKNSRLGDDSDGPSPGDRTWTTPCEAPEGQDGDDDNDSGGGDDADTCSRSGDVRGDSCTDNDDAPTGDDSTGSGDDGDDGDDEDDDAGIPEGDGSGGAGGDDDGDDGDDDGDDGDDDGDDGDDDGDDGDDDGDDGDDDGDDDDGDDDGDDGDDDGDDDDGDDDGDDDDSCETAYALGNSTFGELMDTPRWGWSIGPLTAGDHTADIFAGAGDNDVSKGTKVGTLEITYDGSTALVTFTMEAGVTMSATHLYVGNTALPTSGGAMTAAPGHYGHQHVLDGANTDSFEITGLSGAIHVVAHAVTCAQ